MLLTDPVTSLAYIKDASAEKLRVLGIETVRDLLNHIPRYYSDSRELSRLEEFSKTLPHTAEVTLTGFRSVRIRGGRTLQQATVEDESASLTVVWFNQKYLSRVLQPGDRLLISGKLNPKSDRPQLSSPTFEKIIPSGDALHLGGLIPVYSLTAGVSQKWLRRRIFELIRKIDAIEDLSDPLPASMRKRYNLLMLKEAYRLIHKPSSTADIMAARRRLGFDELLEIQRRFIAGRAKRKQFKSVSLTADTKLLMPVIEQFPFRLSDSQSAALKKIMRSLASTEPMRTLLQGDVGSGKTAVAALAAYVAVTAGSRTAVLAPTVILARQLYDSFRRFLPAAVDIAFISAASKPAEQELRQTDIVIGTHALLNKSDALDNLGLLIIDEQHRFGVAQRKKLQTVFDDRKVRPHTLQLTATPIPRTVAQTLFGDVDVIRLASHKERDNIHTSIVPEDKRDQCISWIQNRLAAGDRVFWVVPSIEDAGEELASIKSTQRTLTKAFGKNTVTIMHGELKENEKLAALELFSTGKRPLMLSTTVIEVGINVPLASVMVIESAERFGLAQLHQLRGRVGRAGQEAWCMMFTSNPASPRLDAFTRLTDGDSLAEFDLKDRGPGEVYGTVQSGIPSLKIASFSNIELMQQALEAAQSLYNSTPVI